MKQFVILFLLFFISNSLINAQHQTCNGNRYTNYAFSGVDSTTNLLFGQNTNMNGVSQNLYLDVFEPTGDIASTRPLIIFIHGGGFMVGNRNEIKPICIDFTQRGFVTATIDYRLIDVPVTDSLIVTEGMIMAVSDAKASIRYFVEDAATANLFKIDTNNIFIAGVSAGAITSLHTAYMEASDNIPPYILNLINQHGGFTGNSSTNTSYSTPIKAVVNYSGALWRKDWISVGEPALYSAHDDLDTIVPCNYGLSKAFPTPFPIYFYGSCVLNPEADNKGILNQIHTVASAAHVSFIYNPTEYVLVSQETSDFLYNILCNNALSVVKPKYDYSVKLFPNPTEGKLSVNFDYFPSNTRIVLFDVYGKNILRVQAQQNNVISLENMASGMYILSVEEEGKMVTRKRIVKR